MKKKYTIIYSEPIRRGSHTFQYIKSNRVEVEPDKLASLIEGDPYWSNVQFIFDGWPLQEGECPQQTITSKDGLYHEAECSKATGVNAECMCRG